MTSKHKTLEELCGSDERLEIEGVDVLVGDAKIKIAFAGGANTAFEKRLAELGRPYQRVIQHGLMDLELARDIEKQAYADTVIKAWSTLKEGTEDEYVRGIKLKNANGEFEIVPDTPANRLQKIKQLPRIWVIIQEEARNLALFRETLREDELKN